MPSRERKDGVDAEERTSEAWLILLPRSSRAWDGDGDSASVDTEDDAAEDDAADDNFVDTGMRRSDVDSNADTAVPGTTTNCSSSSSQMSIRLRNRCW